MKIFILEDEIDSYPRNQLKDVLNGHTLTIAKSVPEAKIKYKGGYDLLLLDHDMNGMYNKPLSCDGNTGSYFAHHLVDFHRGDKESLPRQVVLHSQNPVGRDYMRSVLENAGFICDECPFGPTYVNMLKKI